MTAPWPTAVATGQKSKREAKIRVDSGAHDSSRRQRRSRRLEFGLLGFYAADSLEGNDFALRNKHQDDRNLEEHCKSLGSDRDDRLRIVGRDDVTAVTLQHSRLPSQEAASVALRREVKATLLTISPTTKSSPIAQMFAGSSTASE